MSYLARAALSNQNSPQRNPMAVYMKTASTREVIYVDNVSHREKRTSMNDQRLSLAVWL
jgi:hypothetical protein